MVLLGSIYGTYTWAYCDNEDKSPGYTASNFWTFTPDPENGVLIVIRGSEETP